jgi:nucleoid-associated protein YgaU
MGNFEKMVVLAVLFLSAIVLAVSLNDDGNEVEATGPLSAAAERFEKPVEDPAVETGEAKAGPDYFLFGEVKSPEPEGPVPAPVEAAPSLDLGATGFEEGILVSVRGLRPSAIDDYKVYDAVEGDTWNGLAVRFYGDGRYSSNLRMANEGRELQSGEPIFVPVHDFGQEAVVDRAPLVPEAAPATPQPAPSTPVAIGEVYVVQNGDSLSKIASKAYGNGNLWRQIYDANRDQMRSPDWIQVGMKLVIPDPEQAVAAPAASDPKKPRVR